MSYQLRPVEESHLSWLRNQRNRPEVMDFCRQPFLLNELNQEDWWKKSSRERSMIPFIFAEGQTWIGYVAFSNIDWIARRAEFSVFIMPEYAGKGIGRIAIEMLLDYGFRNLGFQKIYTDTFDINEGEIELLKEMGFQVTGTLPRHYFKRGKLIGSVCHSMFAEDFKLLLREEKNSKPL